MGLCQVLGKKRVVKDFWRTLGDHCVALAPTLRGLGIAPGKISSCGCWRRSQLLSNTCLFPTLDA